MRFVLIGSGRLAVECSRLAASTGMQAVAVATDTADLEEWAASVHADVFDLDRSGLRRLESEDFDCLFSVNNPLILGDELLSRAQRHSFNYHDSPLPGYAGLHATSWALLNGESFHGISWHLMEKTVDSGDVVVERTFEVSRSDTAFTLNIRCFEEALVGFRELLKLLKSGRIEGRRQERDRGRYFGEKDVPFGAGIIEFSQPALAIERLSRALEFGPNFNPLCSLKIILKNWDWFSVGSAREADGLTQLAEGEVGSIREGTWIVGTATAPIRLSGFRDSDGAEVSARFAARVAGISTGSYLPKNHGGLDELTEKTGLLKPHEGFWRRRLLTSSRLVSPKGLEAELENDAGSTTFDEFDLTSVEVSGSSEATVVTAFAIVVSDLFDVEQLDLAFSDFRTFLVTDGARKIFSGYVPLRIDLKDQQMAGSEWEQHVQSEIALCRRRIGFSKDLFSREPLLPVTPKDLRVGVHIRDSNDRNVAESTPWQLVQLIGERRNDSSVTWRLSVSRRLICGQRVRLGSRIQEAIGRLQRGGTPADVMPFPVDEMQSIIATATGEAREYPLDLNFDRLLNSALQRRPDAVAVIEGRSSLTYGELESRSARVAEGLSSTGHRPDRFIGISTERSTEQIVGLLAIAKLGSGFVAIDPELPAGRQQRMAASTGIRVLLECRNLGRFDIPGVEVSSVDEMMNVGAKEAPRSWAGDSSGLAYVTFTSGSTGEPKGVCVRQRSLINFLYGAMEAVEIGPSDRRLQFSTLSFDVALEEIFCSLLSGATLVLRNDDCIGSAIRFADFVEESAISVLDLPTAFFEVWVQSLSEDRRPLPAALKTVVVGGQSLLRNVVETWYELDGSDRVSLVNCYGPAEATVAVTYVTLEKGMEGIPIGKPIPNTVAIPVGCRGRPRPIGLPGEILLGGECLAEGYLGLEEVTRERFPLLDLGFAGEKNSRMYRTGDYGFYQPDGNLHFIGREDRQVKIRGFRIEIEEVEAELGGIDGVASAAVFEADGRLFGAVVSRNLNEGQVRSELASRVPAYMVPAEIIVCDRFNTTANGKIDWEWLKAEFAREGSRGSSLDGGDVPPDQLTVLEEGVVEVFADALGRTNVSLDGDFFESGGDSFGVVRVLGALERITDVRVPIAMFLEDPTPRGLLRSIETLRKDRVSNGGGDYSVESQSETTSGRNSDDAAAVFLVTPLGSAASAIARCMSWVRRPIYNLDIRVLAPNGEPVEHETIADVATELVDELKKLKHESDPCTVVGFSFGGLVACEMVRQLEECGDMVDGLVLIDPSFPHVEMSCFNADQRFRAFKRGQFERRLRRPASLSSWSGRLRHAFFILRERVAVRTRIVWARLLLERLLAGGRWRRRLSEHEELAWFLRKVRKIEKRSDLRAFDITAPVFIFLTSDSYKDDVELRWRLLLGDDAGFEILEGDHLGILNERRVDLEGRLREVFARLERSPAEN